MAILLSEAHGCSSETASNIFSLKIGTSIKASVSGTRATIAQSSRPVSNCSNN